MRYFTVSHYTKPDGQVDEVISVAKNIRTRDIQYASIILDFKNLAVVKATLPGVLSIPRDFDTIVQTYFQHYSSTLTRLFKENGHSVEVTTTSKTNEKTILTDIDGAVLDWDAGFYKFMSGQGYELIQEFAECYDISKRYGIDDAKAKELVYRFNTSPAIENLPPLRDAQEYIGKLHQNGYVFHAITSFGIDPESQELRRKNLRALFGDTAFSDFTFLDIGAKKDKALAIYKDSSLWWIEDNVTNAEDGLKNGLNSIIMLHGYNKNVNTNIHRAANWKEIYQLITS